MCEIEETQSFNIILQTFILSLKASFRMTFSQNFDRNEFYKRIPLILLEIIQQFVYKLNFQEKNTEKVCMDIFLVTYVPVIIIVA